MSLLRNLLLAESAVKYAEQHLRGRASNKPEDIVHTLQRNLRQLYPEYPEMIKDTLGNGFQVDLRMQQIYGPRSAAINDARDLRRQTGNRLNSASIIHDGIGNCFEHSVLACHFLNGKGIQSYMVDTDDNTNHVFVVIGVGGGLDGQTLYAPPHVNPGLPLNTGDSVVCDPWYHEWFGIGQFWVTKMKRILLTTNKRQDRLLPPHIPLTFTHGAWVT
jgi:hypothetical protein